MTGARDGHERGCEPPLLLPSDAGPSHEPLWSDHASWNGQPADCATLRCADERGRGTTSRGRMGLATGRATQPP
eukprot:10569938-Alexandrium_andersonii.AAC.1